MVQKQRILIVDDSEMNRAILTGILGDGYSYVEAENGSQAVTLLQKDQNFDLVLLDIAMPELDGFGVLSIMNEQRWINRAPVIMISAENSSSYVDRAYQMGVTDYISRPFDKSVVRQRVRNTLMLCAKQKLMLQRLSTRMSLREYSAGLMNRLLGRVTEVRTGETPLHLRRIHLAVDMLLHQLVKKTDQYHLSEQEITRIAIASELHDIGKVNIDLAILNKPGPLTTEEFNQVKTHAVAGAKIISELHTEMDQALLRTAYDICHWHHERFDGKGYPDGLVGNAIPISAQAVSIVSVYDALISDRPYRPSFDPQTAMRMILNGACGVFNPLLTSCLTEIQPQMDEQLALVSTMTYAPSIKVDPTTLVPPKPEHDCASFFPVLENTLQFEYVEGEACGFLLTNPSAVPPYHNRYVTETEFGAMCGLSHEDCLKLHHAALATTVAAPDAMLTVQNKQRNGWLKIDLHALWSHADPPRCMGFIGRITSTDPQNRWMPLAELDNHNMSMEDVARVLTSMRDYFDLERVVDPETYTAYRLTPEGFLKASPHPCYSLWNRSKPCENCASCKAVERQNRVTKLELTDSGVYQIIARPQTMEGHICAVELVSKCDSGIWLNVKGSEMLLDQYAQDYYTDRLTGAYRRQYFEDQRDSLENIDGVAMLDVDDFKTINDTYGHPVGDIALKKIANAALSCIRSSDKLIRYGGDEFLVLFPSIPRDAFVQRLKNIQTNVSHLYMDEHPDLQLSISVGGAYKITPIMEAIRRADQAMYEDKAHKGMLRF